MKMYVVLCNQSEAGNSSLPSLKAKKVFQEYWTYFVYVYKYPRPWNNSFQLEN